MRWQAGIIVLIICVAWTPMQGVQADQPDDDAVGLLTPWPVSASGATHASAQDATVLLDPSGTHALTRLQAERVVIEVEWERGVILGDEELVQYAMERGTEEVTIDQADVQIKPFTGEPVVFATSDSGEAEFTWESRGGATFNPVRDELVISKGMGPNTVSSDDELELGFSHTVEGPAVETQGEGTMRMEGSFSMFLHNLGIHAQGQDEDWSAWTGYWESDSGLPVRDYEFRVTTLDVEKGTLVASPGRPMEFYTRALDAHVDGKITTEEATGSLVRDDQILRFDREPVAFVGSGDISLLARDRSTGPVLDLLPSKAFEIQARSITQPDDRDATWLPAWPILPISGLLLATVMTVGVVNAPPVRRRRHESWLRRGQQANRLGRWDDASRCYRKAVRTRRDDLVAWTEWMLAELEAGRGERADQIADQAAKVPGVDRLDLLSLRAAAAWLRDDEEVLREHVSALAEEAPRMAHTLVREIRREPVEFGLQAPASEHRNREGGIDGYV